MMALFEMFQFGFGRDAMWVGTMVAAVCAVLSCFLVLKGWSLMGDAVAHAVLPGIVLAYIAGVPLAIGAFGAGLMCSVGTGFIRQNSRVKEDTVMGVVFTGMFAFGLVLFSRTPSDMHLDHILVGNILGITDAQFVQTMWLGGAVLLITLLMRRDLLLICFDPMQARVMALRDRMLGLLLLCLLSMAIVASLQAVGIILVVAMLVTPGSIAYLWTDRFDRMLIIAVVAAVLSTWFGIWISFQLALSHDLRISTSGCIVLTQALLFVFSLLGAPKYGLLARRT
ncbi:MAG: metal ABC transporter permease [Akkermansiaceae bacterium]|nr:metal ABC transporter permease [Akkermansiaceae bacterium]